MGGAVTILQHLAYTDDRSVMNNVLPVSGYRDSVSFSWSGPVDREHLAIVPDGLAAGARADGSGHILPKTLTGGKLL